MKILVAIFLLVSSLNTCAQKRKLVWFDEFNSPQIDTTKWTAETGGTGFGNNELQYYTKEGNARIDNGILILEARKQTHENRSYTSSKLVTKNKGDWKYGRIEVRAKLPRGRGIWPAIWMLPTVWKYGGWPKRGEIDIMEFVGYEKDSVFGSVHTGAYNHMIGTNKTGSIYGTDFSDSFHVYTIDWNKEEIKFIVDDKVYHTFRNEHKTPAEWPYDEAFYLILNVAVGGNWGGKFGVDDNIFPQRLEIDFVRVYQ